MSAIIRVYERVTREEFGSVIGDTPDLNVPINEVTLASADFQEMGSIITIAAGATAVLYDYLADKLIWQMMRFWTGEGYLNIGVGVQQPVSASNTLPASTTFRWRCFDMSCIRAFGFDSRVVLYNPTIALDAGDTANYPTAFTDAGTVSGYIYRIVAKNPGTSAVRVRRTIVN